LTGAFETDESLPVVEARLSDLPEGLQGHISRSRAIGADLCEIHGVNPEAVDLALAAHDLFKELDDDELLAEAGRRGWEADAVERAFPYLLHGPVAALWLMQEAGIGEPSVIEAVTWHTTYAPNMGPVAAMTFLADKIDPVKVHEGPWLEDVRALSYKKRAEDAVELYLSRLIVRLVEGGDVAHSRTLEALNYLRLGRKAML
jgi:HD superfamily phosphohydrolase YqeK